MNIICKVVGHRPILNKPHGTKYTQYAECYICKEVIWRPSSKAYPNLKLVNNKWRLA